MRIQTRVTLIPIVFAMLWIAVAVPILIKYQSTKLTLAVMVVFGLIQIPFTRFLRCPHCGQYALRTRSGCHVQCAGSKCRHCGQPY